jgi:type IV pilus assembly protein PilE
MKLTPRGFTLVELMIVIAIIGILAAALFPSLTSYLARGRDTSRVSAIKEISTGIAAFNVDRSTFPAGTSNGVSGPTVAECVSANTLSGYVPKLPVDPTATRTSNCGTAGLYGYGTGLDNGTISVLLSAVMENPNGGNSSNATGVNNYQGNALTPTQMAVTAGTSKGAGSGYVIRN